MGIGAACNVLGYLALWAAASGCGATPTAPQCRTSSSREHHARATLCLAWMRLHFIIRMMQLDSHILSLHKEGSAGLCHSCLTTIHMLTKQLDIKPTRVCLGPWRQAHRPGVLAGGRLCGAGLQQRRVDRRRVPGHQHAQLPGRARHCDRHPEVHPGCARAVGGLLGTFDLHHRSRAELVSVLARGA